MCMSIKVGYSSSRRMTALRIEWFGFIKNIQSRRDGKTKCMMDSSQNIVADQETAPELMKMAFSWQSLLKIENALAYHFYLLSTTPIHNEQLVRFYHLIEGGQSSPILLVKGRSRSDNGLGWGVIVQSGQSKGVPMMQDSMAMAWRRSMRIQLLTSPYSLFSSFFTVLYLSSPSMLNAQWQFLFSSSSDSFKSYADSFCIISSSAFSRLLWRAFLMDSHSSYLRSARLKLFLFSSSLSSRASSWLFKLESSLLSLAISSSSLSFSILHSMFQSCSRSISLRNALFSTYSSPMRALSWLILFSRSKFSSLVAMYLWMSMSLYFLSGLSMVASLWRCGVVLMLLAVGGQLRGYSSTVCTAWCLKEGARWSWSHYIFLMACRYWMQSLRISQSQQLSVNCLTQQPISSRVTPISLLTYTTKFSLISINCLFLLIVSSCRCSCHFFSACFRVSNSSVIAGQALRRRSRTDVIALQCWACLEDWEGCLRCLRQESSSGKEGEGACFLRVFSNI